MKKKSDNGLWAELDTQLMVTAAHRYCLGRSSYIVGAAVDWLWKHRKNFERNTIRVIVRDTVEFLQDHSSDSTQWSCDLEDWRSLASKLYAEMLDEDKEWVRSQTSRRDRSWPLIEV